MTFKLTNPQLEAEIYYLTQEEGGRKSYVKSGYRGQFYYNGRDWDAPQEFIDKEICNPGETVKVRLETLSPNAHVGQFYVGQSFEIKEGAKVVGLGKITKILSQDFKKWDFNTFFEQLPKDCKPYYGKEHLDGFIEDCHYALGKIFEIKKIKITKALSDKNCMVNINATLKNDQTQKRELSRKFCDTYKEYICLENSFFKTNFKYVADKFQFELIFATYNNMYLTGKITVGTI